MGNKRETLINRYDDPILSEYYPEILACCPEYEELRNIVATIIKNNHLPNERILDIGAGRGDSAKPILEAVGDITIDMLDVSADLLGEADELLSKHKGRYKIILEDALTYFDGCLPYRTIHSAFTVHNFYQEDKEKLLTAVFKNLEPNGSFILLDKIQPDDVNAELGYFETQTARYRDGLPPKVADALIAHEEGDLKEGVRMREQQTIEMLQKLGFKEVSLIKRIKRDVVIKAVK